MAFISWVNLCIVVRNQTFEAFDPFQYVRMYNIAPGIFCEIWYVVSSESAILFVTKMMKIPKEHGLFSDPEMVS